MSDWCLIVRTWGDTPATLIVCLTLGRRHQHVAQCCRNIQSSFSMCLGIQKTQGAALTEKNVYINLYIFWIIWTYSINKKNKKGASIWGFFILTCKCKVLVPSMSVAKTRELSNQHMPCNYQRREYILYLYFQISMFLKQEMITKSRRIGIKII